MIIIDVDLCEASNVITKKDLKLSEGKIYLSKIMTKEEEKLIFEETDPCLDTIKNDTNIKKQYGSQRNFNTYDRRRKRQNVNVFTKIFCGRFVRKKIDTNVGRKFGKQNNFTKKPH
jgi:hypothetical protein